MTLYQSNCMKNTRLQQKNKMDPPQKRFSAIALAMLALAPGVTLAGNLSWNVGDGNWIEPTNWSPWGAEPTSNDNVFIGNLLPATNKDVIINNQGSAASLTITNGMQLKVDGIRLQVYGDTFVSGKNTAGNITHPSTLRVDGGGGLTKHFGTQNLTLANEAVLFLRNDPRLEIGGLLNSNTGSSIWGNGKFSFTGSGTVLRNNGTILHSQPQEAPLTFSAPNGFFDLDGTSGNGIVQLSAPAVAQTSATTFQGIGLTDAFDGTVNINGGNSLAMDLDQSWTLGSGGLIRFYRGNGLLGKVTGSPMVMRGNVFLQSGFNFDAARASIESPVTIETGANIHVGSNAVLRFQNGQHTTINGGTFTLAQGETELNFHNPTTLTGGSFSTASMSLGDGRLRFLNTTTWNGMVNFAGQVALTQNAHVSGPTIINADSFSMNVNNSATWTLDEHLTLNAHGLSSDFVHTDVAQTSVNFVINSDNGLAPGKLTVNILSSNQSWISTGDITINGPGGKATSTSIDGSDLTLRGKTTVNGNTRFGARIDLLHEVWSDDATILLNPNASLRLEGGTIGDYNTMIMGNILGPGEIQAAPEKALFGHGLISAPVRFLDNSQLRAKGGLLQLSGGLLDMGTLGTDSADATLEVVQPWNTSVTQLVELRGGMLKGGKITNDGPSGIVGHGTVTAAIDNNSLIAAQDGTLIVANILNEWDGSSGTGQLHALTGNLNVIGQAGANGFRGEVSIARPHELSIVGFDAGFQPASEILMAGGTIRADATQTFGGHLRVTDHAADLFAATHFRHTSTTQLDNRLNLRLDSVVEAGALFMGEGNLANHAQLDLRHNAQLGLNLNIFGSLHTESGAVGHAGVAGNVLLAGIWNIDLAGNSPDFYDRLVISDTFTARGDFMVNLLGYAPLAGDVFDVLDFGTFIDLGYGIDLPGLNPGLAWDVSEFETLGQLRVIPEPSTLSLLALAACGFLRRRRIPAMQA